MPMRGEKEMSSKDGFVCITGLPCELREGQGKGVYLRCQNNRTMWKVCLLRAVQGAAWQMQERLRRT